VSVQLFNFIILFVVLVGSGYGVAGSCPDPTKGQNGICDRMGDECTIDSTCSGADQKCCFNGCQRQCLEAVGLPTGMSFSKRVF
jgi:hypothetical protein